MSSDGLTHDATASAKGTIYQLYWAVQKCFEMISGQKIVIERYGDVTVAASQQLEIKHYGDALTDSHLNLWKTLKNWMRDGFNETSYSALMLCTTQQIGDRCSLSANGIPKASKIGWLFSIQSITKQKDANVLGLSLKALSQQA